MSKTEWRNYVKIRDKLLNFGGVIFGGAIRDEILHNVKATEFYKEQHEYYLSHPSDKPKKTYEYDNKKISLHTLDRLLIPTDIDVMFDIKKVDELIHYLMRDYKLQVCKIKDMSYFKNEIPKGIYKLFKLDIVSQYKDKFFLVKLDVIGIDTTVDYVQDPFYEIPLKYDFDVNSLFWSKDKGLFSKMLINYKPVNIHIPIQLHNIITNIENKVANMNSEFLWHDISDIKECDYKESRVIKLKKKGWKIKIETMIYKFINSEFLEEDDSCLVCLKNKKDLTNCVNFKRCSCKSFICLDCMKTEYSKLVKCPTCRQVIIEDNSSLIYAKNELYFYEKFVIE